jgi:hypothetical protein
VFDVPPLVAISRLARHQASCILVEAAQPVEVAEQTMPELRKAIRITCLSEKHKIQNTKHIAIAHGTPFNFEVLFKYFKYFYLNFYINSLLIKVLYY